jgi:hypothetical protein
VLEDCRRVLSLRARDSACGLLREKKYDEAVPISILPGSAIPEKQNAWGVVLL